MSSSNQTRPVDCTPWALDELTLPDIFTMPTQPMHRESVVESGEDPFDPSPFAVDPAQIEADAYARGVADGEVNAPQLADAMIATSIRALGDAIESVRAHEARWTSNAEENVAALAIMVARHLVQREVDADPEIVRSLVHRALSQFPLDQVITVRLNPADVASCGATVTPDAAGRMRDVRWISDAHILRGGCLVEGRERIIDGRVDTSLERAYRAVGQVQA